MKMCIHGACGRMGREVIRAATAATGIDVCAALESASHPQLGKDAGTLSGLGPLGVDVTADVDAALASCHVAVDFSTVEGAATLARALIGTPRPAVVAVTALPDQVRIDLERASREAPVMLASNLSVGAAVLRLMSARAARALTDFDVEVVEAHHTGKVDAPSGTAMDIAAAVARARDLDPREAIVYGRRPGEGPREAACVGVHAVRGGTVTGEHQVMLLGHNERVVLSHSAESRAIFARGALRAARWLRGRSPGLYGMDDMVSDALDL